MAKKDAGKAYLEAVLRTVPEDKQAKVKELLEDDLMLELIGDGVMLKSDYSRNFAKLKESREGLDEWYQNELKTNSANAELAIAYQKAVEEGRLLEPGTKPSKRRPAVDDDEGVQDPGESSAAVRKIREAMLTKDEGQQALRQGMANTAQSVSNFNNAVIRLAFQHQAKFNEILDPDKLIAHAAEVKAPTLEAAYQSLYGDRIQTWQEGQEKSARQKLRDEVRTEVLAELKKSGPYPIHVEESQEESGTAMSGMKSGATEFSAEAAADDYARRVASRVH